VNDRGIKIPIPAVLLFAGIALTALLVIVSFGAGDNAPGANLGLSAGTSIVETSIPTYQQKKVNPPTNTQIPVTRDNPETTTPGAVFISHLPSDPGAALQSPPALPPETIVDETWPLTSDWTDPDDEGFTVSEAFGTTISGRVTDPWGNGISGVFIEPFAAEEIYGPDMTSTVFTDEHGYYSIRIANIARNYRLHFSKTGELDRPVNGRHYRDEWYNNSFSRDGAVIVPVGAEGVDAVLSPTGALHVHINIDNPEYDSFEYFPMEVIAYRADKPEPVRSVATYFMFGAQRDLYFSGKTSLPPGEYKLLISPGNLGGSPAGYGPFWFGQANSWESAETVQVTPGRITDVEVTPRRTTSVFGQLFVNAPAALAAAGSEVSLVRSDAAGEVVATTPLERSTNDHEILNFYFMDVPAGNYKLKHVLGNGAVVWYRVNGGTDNFSRATTLYVFPELANGSIGFSIEAPAFELLANVKDGDGSPVSGLSIEARDMGADGSIIISIPGSTDSNGFIVHRWYEVDSWNRDSLAIPRGIYRFCVTGTHYCTDSTYEIDWYDRLMVYIVIFDPDGASPLSIPPGSNPPVDELLTSGELDAAVNEYGAESNEPEDMNLDNIVHESS